VPISHVAHSPPNPLSPKNATKSTWFPSFVGSENGYGMLYEVIVGLKCYTKAKETEATEPYRPIYLQPGDLIIITETYERSVWGTTPTYFIEFLIAKDMQDAYDWSFLKNDGFLLRKA
jgi:hypothetical protein